MLQEIQNKNTLETIKWFEQFDDESKTLIKKGLEKNLNISIYARPEFSFEQMEVIYLGLLDEIEVELYANEKISFEDMLLIREELLKNKNE